MLHIGFIPLVDFHPSLVYVLLAYADINSLEILVNIGLGNRVLPDGTTPLPEQSRPVRISSCVQELNRQGGQTDPGDRF